MKLTEIILDNFAPQNLRAVWLHPADTGIEVFIYNNGKWEEVSVLDKSGSSVTIGDKGSEFTIIAKDGKVHVQNQDGTVYDVITTETSVGQKTPQGGEIFNDYNNNSAGATYAHAEGQSNTATGNASHAEGIGNQSTGANSHSEGNQNKASGSSSHSEGYKNVASGSYSHAEGSNNQSNGSGSHAEGNSNIVNSNYAHAEGNSNEVTGQAAHAEGSFNQTTKNNEHAEGRYNKSNSGSTNLNTIHSVGIGSESKRQNAHEIMLNGDHYVYGLGGYDGTNPSESSTLQAVINGKAESFTVGAGLKMNGKTLSVTLDNSVFIIRDSLPATPADSNKGKIFLIPLETSGESNTYVEYLWVVDESHPDGHWEELGTYIPSVDLSPYLKKTEAESTYATKESLQTLQTQVTEIDDRTSVYTVVPTLSADYTIPANMTTREYIYEITIGDTVYNVTAASGTSWVDNNPPLVEANSKLIVSVINNIAVWGIVYE